MIMLMKVLICTSDTITLEVGSNSIDVMLDDGFNTTKENKEYLQNQMIIRGFSQYIIFSIVYHN